VQRFLLLCKAPTYVVCSQCLFDYSKRNPKVHCLFTRAGQESSNPRYPILFLLSFLLILYQHPLLSFPCGIFSYLFAGREEGTTHTHTHTQTVNSNIQVFWCITSSRVINAYRRFGRASVTTCQPAGCSTLEDLSPHHTAVRTLKSRTDELVSSKHALTAQQCLPLHAVNR
jgi:hypothetical protein